MDTTVGNEEGDCLRYVHNLLQSTLKHFILLDWQSLEPP